MIKATTLAIMAVFYIAYFAKQIAQRRQGVSTMILGKGTSRLSRSGWSWR